MDNFDKFFPKHAAKFGVNAFDVDRWVAEAEDGGLIVTGQYLLWSADLLKRCASWYEHRNLFAHPSFSLLFNQFREAHSIMTKRSFTRTPAIEKASFVGFLEYRLNDDQLEALDGWSPSTMDIFGYCDELVRHGFKLSLSYNQNTHLATCSIMDERKKLPNGEKNPAGGYMLSTSDSDCSLALKAAMYKHFHALEMSWVALISAPSQGGRRG